MVNQLKANISDQKITITLDQSGFYQTSVLNAFKPMQEQKLTDQNKNYMPNMNKKKHHLVAEVVGVTTTFVCSRLKECQGVTAQISLNIKSAFHVSCS